MFPAGSVATPPRRSPNAVVLKYADVARHPSPSVSVAVSELPVPHAAPTVRGDVAPPPRVETVFGSAIGVTCAPAHNGKSTQNTERTSAARRNLRNMACLRGNARLNEIERTGVAIPATSVCRQKWSNLLSGRIML